MSTTLDYLGYHAGLEAYRQEQNLASFLVGRVVSEHKERYVVRSDEGEFQCELIGNLRYAAEGRHDFPAVGDWVAISEYDEAKALIHAIFPRQSIIERQAIGKSGETQIIATNIDVGLIVQAVNRDFNTNRLERYITICNASKVKPVIVLSKIDLLSKKELADMMILVTTRIPSVPVFAVSNQIDGGYDRLKTIFEVGKTYCLLGSSGVGKSTLLNQISGEELMKTGEISTAIGRGKHVTTHRELLILDNGSIMIDNPGMREVGIADVQDGLALTFDLITELANNCKFKDCTHLHEKGCAVLEALDNGEIDQGDFDNFQKLQREQSHFEMTKAERRKKDKETGKLYKRIINNKKRTRL